MPSCCCRTTNNLPDGRVEIPRCTIVFSSPADDEAQRRRQSIILEAPDGAVLKFDQPLDLSRAKVGRLVGGQLNGPVTIRSDWKEPGPEDDLLVTATGDINSPSRPSPRRAGRFPLGPAFRPRPGHGHQALGRPAGAGHGRTRARMSPASSRSSLRHVERLHLDLGQTPSCAGRKAGQRAGRDQLPRPVPLRRGGPRGHVSRSRGSDESEPCRPVRSALVRTALVVLHRAAEDCIGASRRQDRSEDCRLARPGAAADRSPRQSGRCSPRPAKRSYRPRRAAGVRSAGQLPGAGRRPRGLSATGSERNPRPQPLLRIGRRRPGAFGPRGGPRARLAPRPIRPIGRISSWRPFGRTSCASSATNETRSSR